MAHDVTKRCVFYLSGFDPKGPSYYHALYCEEGGRQSRQDGWRLDVGDRRRQASHNAYWTVDASFNEHRVQTHYEFMRWDDLVRHNWKKTTWTIWRDVISTTFFYLRHGTLWKMFCLSWPPTLVALMPFLLVWAMLLGVPLVAMGCAWVIQHIIGSIEQGLVVGGLISMVLWVAGRKFETRYSIYWMTRSHAFTARQARGEVLDLENRLDQMARRLVERIEARQDDEVLVVGHSTGSIMAVSVLARAVKLSPNLLCGPTSVSLLTLGQWIPLLGLLPMARQFRTELEVLSGLDGLSWVDFSAPSDGCCFALTDPFKACGIGRDANSGVDLKILNPRFAMLFDEASYAALKRNKFLMHFQYLRATQRIDGYNYFAITAGSMSLKSRFASVANVSNYADLRPFG